MTGTPDQWPAGHGSLYQRLLWFYPPGFRREYGKAMVQVFCDRLREETRDRPRGAAVRIWLQALRDLALSVPNERIEVFMSEFETTARLLSLIVLVALSVVAVASIGAPGAVLLVAVAAWFVYQRTRRRYAALPGQGRWYRWVLGGVAVHAIAWTLVFSLEGDWVWGVWATCSVLGLLAVAAGVAMGVRDLHRHPRGPTPA